MEASCWRVPSVDDRCGATMTNKGSSKCSHLLAIEIFATALHRRQQFASTEKKKIQTEEMRKVSSSPRTPTGGGGATRTHKSPEVHKTRNEALEQRRRQEHSRQRSVSEAKNRSDMTSNCAPPICTLNMERHALASFTLSVPLTYSTVET